MRRLGEHAIVLGASVAGLMAAKVLSMRFGRVTVIERDLDPSGPAARKGVPQGRHVHGLWARGLATMERLAPGLTAELVAGGAMQGDTARDFNWHQFGAHKLRTAVDVPATTVTRPFLEAALRRRIARTDRIDIRYGCSAEALLADRTRGRVTGVALRDADGRESTLAAELVLDATGRGSRLPEWLASLGYPRPPESTVRIDVTYATRMYRRGPGATTIGNVLVQTPPQGRRGGVAFAVEGDRWLVTLVGFLGERPPLEPEGFDAYARSLPFPSIHDIVRTCEPIGDIQPYRFASNLRRHYERLARFPEGLLVVGDAVCSFNPAYGQGMTVAATELDALERALDAQGRLEGIAPRFFRAIRPLVDVPWMLTTGEDFRYPQVEGRRPPPLPLINAYVARLHRVAAYDAVVCRAFFEVAGMQKGPFSLFAPSIASRVIRGEAAAARRLKASTTLAPGPVDSVNRPTQQALH